jgi:hypothetical protein
MKRHIVVMVNQLRIARAKGDLVAVILLEARLRRALAS